MPRAALRAAGVRLESRPHRITRVARKLARRSRKQSHYARRPMRRTLRKGRVKRMIAYDLETTRIQAGTPEVRYISAFGDGFKVSQRIDTVAALRAILEQCFLIDSNAGARFVAWNGNNFDVFFIGQALLSDKRYILRPYLTRSKALRGIKVTQRKKGADGKALSWEFLDGMAMTVGVPTKLAAFLATFAPPEFQKLAGPDFESENFNADNPEHVRYAERDSEGLFYALQKAQSITLEHFGQGLQPTIGNLGIRIFQQNMPEEKTVWPLAFDLDDIIRRFVMRGGFCFASRRYMGPCWKYDINQAYAAAMRDADLPAGRAQHCQHFNPFAKCAIYRVNGRNANNRVPFYCRDSEGISQFALCELESVWITSSEYEQLKAERWTLTVIEGYFWDDGFRMTDLVNRLEALRMADPGGPNGAQGTMIKAIGNNSYGKTVEELDGLEFQMSLERPDDSFVMYQNAEDVMPCIWCRIGESQAREYHQPQVGAFITARVRMEVRRAILKQPKAWLYSDTDCAFFDCPVSTIAVDPKLYGLWKIESDGDWYRVITKKVYCRMTPIIGKDGKQKWEMKAKGLNIRHLNMGDFERWYNGTPPTQTQTQRQNFLSVMSGGEMYVERVKVGQRL